MAQILRDPTTFQMFCPATGMIIDFDQGSDGRATLSPSHNLIAPPAMTLEGRAPGLYPIQSKAVTSTQGTIQVEGSYSHIAQAQTIVYLSPGFTPHGDCISVEATLLGRASVRIWDKRGDVVVQVSSSVQLSPSFWLRFVWDSAAPVEGSRFAALYIGGAIDKNAGWSVDPQRPWTPLEVQYIGIRNEYGGTWPLNGALRKVLISDRTNIKF